MDKPTIELISCESGEWEVLRVTFPEGDLIKQETFQGHSISNWNWIKLLELLGYEVQEKTVSDEDEDMEMENY